MWEWDNLQHRAVHFVEAPLAAGSLAFATVCGLLAPWLAGCLAGLLAVSLIHPAVRCQASWMRSFLRCCMLGIDDAAIISD